MKDPWNIRASSRGWREPSNEGFAWGCHGVNCPEPETGRKRIQFTWHWRWNMKSFRYVMLISCSGWTRKLHSTGLCQLEKCVPMPIQWGCKTLSRADTFLSSYVGKVQLLYFLSQTPTTSLCSYVTQGVPYLDAHVWSVTWMAKELPFGKWSWELPCWHSV